jgi:hypothetical protein
VSENTPIVLDVSVGELIVSGMTSNKLASLIAMLVIGERLVGDVIREEVPKVGGFVD